MDAMPARAPSEPRLGKERVVSNILKLIADTAGGRVYEAVGMGTPGTYHPGSDIMCGAPHTPLYEKPGLVSSLRAKLLVPLIIENDTDCLALAEFFEQYHGHYHSVMAVILGGGVSSIPLWYDHVPPYLHKYLFGVPDRHIPILKAKLGDSAGVLGAASLARHEMGLLEF